MKRKAVEKSCEPDIRNEFSISLVRITKSVNDHFCASSWNNIYLGNTLLTASFLKLTDTYKKQSKLHQAPESIMVIKVWLTEYDQQNYWGLIRMLLVSSGYLSQTFFFRKKSCNEIKTRL